MTKLRGLSLSDSTVVEWLQPFIVVGWAGFDLETAPALFRKHVSRSDFGPNAKGGAKSNSKLLFFDENGKLVHAADSVPDMNARRWEETAPRHMVEQVRTALSRLGGATSKSALREVALPGLKESGVHRAVRIFSGLEEKKSDPYNIPFVEVQPIVGQEWDSLTYPSEAKNVEASVLQSSFAHVYPPGMMDRAAPPNGTRPVLSSLEGHWTLSPAGGDGKYRYAVLTGKARLIYKGRGDYRFSYEGDFEALITYGVDDASARSITGVFEAVYPRTAERMAQREAAQMPFAAIFETLSD